VPVYEKYNFTPFLADFALTQDNNGLDCIVCIVKATYAFSDLGETAAIEREEMSPILGADQFHGSPEESSLLYPADIVYDKQGTDVIINGHAYAHGKAAVDAGFKLGSMSKILRCFGTRRWERGLSGYHISPPEPYDHLALKYELAFGGSITGNDGNRKAFPYNPVGVGYTTGNAEGQLLPHIEYRQHLIATPRDCPPPAAFGAVPRHWRQRVEHAGTYDEAWMASRRPLLPLDFDLRFHNAVAQDQVSTPVLRGGEELILYRLHPRVPELRLVLPRPSPVATLRVDRKSRSFPMVMDTLAVEPDDNRLTMTFRCTCPLDGRHTLLKSVHFQSDEDPVRPS